MNKHTLILGSLAFAAAATLTACGGSASGGGSSKVDANCKPAHKVTTISKGALTVSMAPNMPYAGIKGGKLTGIDGEVVNAIAAKECLSVKIVQGDTAAVLQTVQTRRADVAIAGWWRTDERAKILRQSTPVYYSPTVFVSKSGIDELSTLKGKDLGTVGGAFWTPELQKYLGSDHVKIYKNNDSLFRDLEVGRLDAVITSAGEGGYGVVQGALKGMKVEPVKATSDLTESQSVGQVNFPSTKGNDALGKALDADIAGLRQDGTVKKVLTKYGLTSNVVFSGKA